TMPSSMHRSAVLASSSTEIKSFHVGVYDMLPQIAAGLVIFRTIRLGVDEAGLVPVAVTSALDAFHHLCNGNGHGVPVRNPELQAGLEI
ncbi:hypothetical protein V5799_017975, partial [Amblyomma americanum]